MKITRTNKKVVKLLKPAPLKRKGKGNKYA